MPINILSKPSALDLAVKGPSFRLILSLAVAAGLIVANIYYVQPLAGLIGKEFAVPADSAGFFVTFTQIGYGLGLLLVAPLSDLMENRRLIVGILGVLCLALAVMAGSVSAQAFFLASFAVGLTSVAVQVIVPFAGHLAAEATRGRVVGTVMSGLFFGIMLARPFASFMTYYFGWRALFLASATEMAVLAFILRKVLPSRKPESGLTYGAILRSLYPLARNTPVLQRRAFYHSMLFAAFSLFWTGVPLLLAGEPYHFSQFGIGLFSLVGAAGAIVAPLAGRAADHGLIRPLTFIAIFCAALSFGIAYLGNRLGSVMALGSAAILLDMALSANLIISQRAIFSLAGAIRGRLNGLFMAAFFMSGALGSALASLTFLNGGWAATSATGAGMGLLAFAYALTERKKP